MQRLRLWLCGGFRCHVDARELAAPQRRDVARLLSLLALNAPQPLSRAEAAAALWPMLPSDRGRASLRLILHGLQQYLGQVDQAHGLLAVGESLGWAPSAEIWVDLQQTIADAAAADQTCSLPETIPWGELPDWPDAWFEPWRMRFDAARAALLDRSGTALEAAGDRPGAKRDSLRLLTLRPTDEATNLRLLRLLAGEGDRAGARRHLQACRQAFEDDLGRQPSAAFLEAALQLLGSLLPVAGGAAEPLDPGLHLLPTIDGRGRLDRLREAVARHPLVVIQGSAACGKSRLLERLRATLDSAHWLDLAAASAEPPFATLLAEASGQGSTTTPDWLLLDHVESLPPQELERLLLQWQSRPGGDPRTVLASRRPLGLRGAHRWPMELPGPAPYLQADEAGSLLRSVWRDREPPPALDAGWAALALVLAGRPLALLVAADLLRRAPDPAAAAADLARDPGPLLTRGLAGTRFGSLADCLAADAQWLDPGGLAGLRLLARESGALPLATLAEKAGATMRDGEGWNRVQDLIQAGLLRPDHAAEAAEPRYRLDPLTRCYWSGRAADGAAP